MTPPPRGVCLVVQNGGGGTENEKNGEKMVTTEGKRAKKGQKGEQKWENGKKRQTLMGGNKGDKKGQKKGAKRDQKEVN